MSQNKQYHKAKKIRKLKYLCKRLSKAMSFKQDKDLISQLMVQIARLVSQLRDVIHSTQLKRMLGPAALLFGVSLSSGISAQGIYFDPPVTNPFGLSSVYYFALPEFADMDGDGDLDLIVGEYYGVFQYFENTGSDTTPQFAAPVANPFGLDSAYVLGSTTAGDLDGDGDIDLMVGEYYGNLAYFENTGDSASPQFGMPQNVPFGLDSTYLLAFPEFADLDNDGDLDLLVGEYYGAVKYFENIGSSSSPQFAAAQINPFGIDSSGYGAIPSLGDIDNDGDLDLMMGDANNYGFLRYFKNIGTAASPQFAPPIVNPFGVDTTRIIATPALGDLDGDGDLDLLLGNGKGELLYHEQKQWATSIDDMVKETLFVYPNPSKELFNVSIPQDFKKGTIQIFNIIGEEILTKKFAQNPATITLKIEGEAGLYIISVKNEKGEMISSTVIKE